MSGPFIQHARTLIANGYSPLPIRPGGKRPVLDAWDVFRSRQMSEGEISATAHAAGLGVAGGFGDLVPIDVDTEDPEIRAVIRAALPKATIVKKGKRGATVFFRGVVAAGKLKDCDGKMLLEVLSTGQSVIPPTIHPETGNAYAWLTKTTLFDTPIAELPEITEAHIAAVRAALAPWLPPPRVWTPRTASGASKPSSVRLKAYAEAALESEARALAAMPKDSGRNRALFDAACKLGNYVHHGVLAMPDLENALFGACNSNGVMKEDGERTCMASLASGLRKAEGDELRQPPDETPQPSERRKSNSDRALDARRVSAERPNGLPPCSDQAIALEFAERHKDGLRYTHAWGKWHRFAGGRWNEEETLLAYDLASELCRETAGASSSASERKDTVSAKKRAAVVSLAREDRRLAATIEQWDTDRWLLNTPRGTIDLRTQEEREHRADDYITRRTAVAPGGACPLWRAFIRTITKGDDELAAFLQRMAGYALTGDVSEHALFFALGPGGNGKGVFVGTLAGIFGDYHRTAPIETFTVSVGERHPTELAMLRGARLVTSSETEEGRQWAESRVKQLTGGDRITARFMHKDFFEYDPQFKLFIIGNHMPSLRNVDEAIRRRLHLMPFDAIIPEGDRDPDLQQKLAQEWPGILQWCLDGLADYLEHGLAPPAAVRAATDSYLASEDDVLRWLDECCTRLGSGQAPLSALYASWRAWSEAGGINSRNDKWLIRTLVGKGFGREKLRAGVQILGLRLGRAPDR